MILALFLKTVTSIALTQNTKFDIAVISLEREINRRTHMNEILSAAECNFRIFDAVDGSLVMTKQKDISYYSGNYDLSHIVERHMSLGPRYYGTTGLKLTHFILLKQMEESKTEKPLLILEDDVDLECDFVNIIEKTLESIKYEWDIILLTPRYWKDVNRQYDSSTGLEGMIYFYGTYGMLVNGSKTAAKLIELLEGCPLTEPIDNFYAFLAGNKSLNCFARPKSIITHLGNIFSSTIATSYPVWPFKLENSLYEFTKSCRLKNE